MPLELLDHIQHPEARLDKSKPVYVISYTEVRAKAFCNKLEAYGYRTFYIEEGGVEAWCKQNLKTLKSCRDTNKWELANTNGTKPNSSFNFEIAIKPIIPLGHYFRSIVGVAWFFEKMNCNIKFVFKESFNYFENSTLQLCRESSPENYIALQLPIRQFDRYDLWIPAKHACSVISRLTIKKEIQEQADEWVRANLKTHWIGIHFRGTDRTTQSRYFIEIDTYISYLKKVVAKNCSIFVCSDQAQFVDRMNETFPGRVFSRDIQRSYDNRNLHRTACYANQQQRIDALIDLLILSKANLVYKTTGEFANLVRFFNPIVKIVAPYSDDHLRRKYLSKNFVRFPKAHLLVKQSFLKYYYGKIRARLRNI